MPQVELTPAEIKLLATVLALDLDAIGLSQSQQRLAASIQRKLSGTSRPTPAITNPREIARRDPFYVLRLSPSFQRENK